MAIANQLLCIDISASIPIPIDLFSSYSIIKAWIVAINMREPERTNYFVGSVQRQRTTNNLISVFHLIEVN
jgi:hypothetical protein